MTEICQKTLLSNEAILQHLLVIHCVSLEDLFEQLPIKRLDRTTIKENAAINSAAESTAVIRDSNSKQLYHNWNNLSNTHNITNTIENGDFKLEQDWVAFMSQPYWVKVETEIDLSLRLKWGWVEVEVELKFSQNWVEVELSWVVVELRLN